LSLGDDRLQKLEESTRSRRRHDQPDIGSTAAVGHDRELAPVRRDRISRPSRPLPVRRAELIAKNSSLGDESVTVVPVEEFWVGSLVLFRGMSQS
jgi:hypothetical protein